MQRIIIGCILGLYSSLTYTQALSLPQSLFLFDRGLSKLVLSGRALPVVPTKKTPEEIANEIWRQTREEYAELEAAYKKANTEKTAPTIVVLKQHLNAFQKLALDYKAAWKKDFDDKGLVKNVTDLLGTSNKPSQQKTAEQLLLEQAIDLSKKKTVTLEEFDLLQKNLEELQKLDKTSKGYKEATNILTSEKYKLWKKQKANGLLESEEVRREEEQRQKAEQEKIRKQSIDKMQKIFAAVSPYLARATESQIHTLNAVELGELNAGYQEMQTLMNSGRMVQDYTQGLTDLAAVENYIKKIKQVFVSDLDIRLKNLNATLNDFKKNKPDIKKLDEFEKMFRKYRDTLEKYKILERDIPGKYKNVDSTVDQFIAQTIVLLKSSKSLSPNEQLILNRLSADYKKAREEPGLMQQMMQKISTVFKKEEVLSEVQKKQLEAEAAEWED